MIEWSKVTYFESEAKGFVHTVLRSQELEILPSAMIILLPLLRGGSAGSNSRVSPRPRQWLGLPMNAHVQASPNIFHAR